MKSYAKTNKAFDIYGTVYELRCPSVRESQEYASAIKGKDDDEAGEELMRLLDKCGLPEKVGLDMEADHLVDLVKELMPDSKK